jgi:hypothetical protein
LDFKTHYEKELLVLSREYETYLNDKFVIPTSANDRAKYYFGRKSIFYKVCPRYVAKQLHKAWELYNQNRFKEAKEKFEELIRFTDNYSPLIGLSYCYVEQGENQKAIDLLRKNINKFENTAYHYEIQFLLADLLAKNNQISGADSIYKLLVSQNPSRTLYSLSNLRTDLINADSVIVNYLQSEDEEKYNILKLLNAINYNYNSVPYLSSLARSSKVEYNNFLKNFSKPFEVNDYRSSYGIYKLSLYMCEKLDFDKARKMAALSLRYSDDPSFNSVLQSNFARMNWLYKNSGEALSKMKYY